MKLSYRIARKLRHGMPYVLHSLAVMMKGRSPEAMMVGVLHDVVEDTEVTLDDLRRAGFPDKVVAAVDCVTRREGETEEDYLNRVKGNALARQVKLADLEENMDLRRIPQPGERDWRRMEKYRRAWDALAE